MYAAAYGGLAPETLPVSHGHDAFFDHLSAQVAYSQLPRRTSRPSAGQQRPGSVMRVQKPSSANNSPRSSTTSRRRTMMVDCSTPHRQRQALDYFGFTQGNDVMMPVKQSMRPLSWQPSSYMQQAAQWQRQQQTAYPLPASSMYAEAHEHLSAQQPHFSPAMASYSNDTSPCSTFSPLPLFPGQDDAACLQADAWDFSQRPTPFYNSYVDGRPMQDQLHTMSGTGTQRSLASGGADWESFIMQRYDNTSPPTPETFPQMEHSQPAVSEGGLCYEALEKEEEGEILVGMGLYDTPDKVDEDPQLNNYRSTVSSLLGSSLRPQEPRGKGLKLEETWEPPQSEDGEEEEEDDEHES